MEYGYKIGYYKLGRFKATVVTDKYWAALDCLEYEKQKNNKKKWIIKPLSQREYARGVWRDCPF